MSDGTGLAEALLGLEGFRVLDVTEGPDELVVTVESDARVVGCSRCGVPAEAQDRMPIDIRDLSCFGRPARLVWIKRRWRCTDADCDARLGRSTPITSMPRRCSPAVPALRPAARSVRKLGPSPGWPPSSACAGGR